MQWIQKQLRLKARPRGVHLVTREVLDALPELAGLEVGILHLFIQHTSASLAINENADPDVNLVVLGDFNAFEFTDGYVDVLGQIKGTPSDATQAMIPGTDEVDPDLTDQVLNLTATDRYSYVHHGNAQVLTLNRCAGGNIHLSSVGNG